MLVIDGSHGEGGGAVLRNSLALSAVLGQPVRIEGIRAKRPNPGLQAQHLTSVRALAEVCRAKVEGADLGSKALVFHPQSAPQNGQYSWDVAAARKGGSAGATSLVFQALLLPLLFAEGDSALFLQGGTHVAWSPPFHYLEQVYLPTLSRLGAHARVELERWGWYPIGGGVMTARVTGSEGKPFATSGLELMERGKLKKLSGMSAFSNLPGHIGKRQRHQAESLLRAEGFEAEIEIVDAPSRGQGTVLFLVAEFENVCAGFTSLGRKGKPAEKVAEEACHDFLQYHKSGAALDQHLADQLVLPLSMAQGTSSFSTCRITQHLLTNVWIVDRLLGRGISVEGAVGEAGIVSVAGAVDV